MPSFIDYSRDASTLEKLPEAVDVVRSCQAIKREDCVVGRCFLDGLFRGRARREGYKYNFESLVLRMEYVFDYGGSKASSSS